MSRTRNEFDDNGNFCDYFAMICASDRDRKCKVCSLAMSRPSMYIRIYLAAAAPKPILWILP
jgi:hypothetical protein